MAGLSVTNYERALDDITRQGIQAIRSTHKPVASRISNSAYAALRAVHRGEKAQHGVSGAILHSIQARPYTTLAIAGLIGFACGALRR